MPHLYFKSENVDFVAIVTKGYEDVVTITLQDVLESFEDNVHVLKVLSNSSKCSKYKIQLPSNHNHDGYGFTRKSAATYIPTDELHVVLLEELGKLGWYLIKVKAIDSKSEQGWTFSMLKEE